MSEQPETPAAPPADGDPVAAPAEPPPADAATPDAVAATATAGDGAPTAGPVFRLLLVPGVVPASWVRTWRERVTDVALELVHAPAADAGAVLAAGGADAALLRLPVDRTVLSAIPLYVETTVVVLPKDHLLTALDAVTPADLADETLLVPQDDVLRWVDPPGEPSLLPAPATTEAAVELVAAGVGLLAVPQSLARLHHRRDLTYRPFAAPDDDATDADATRAVPTSQAALAWAAERDGDPLVEELIGVVRGRTVNSSRGRGATTPDDGRDERAGRGGAAGARPTSGAAARTGRSTQGGSGGRGKHPGGSGRGAAGRRGGPGKGGSKGGGRRGGR